MTKASTIIIVLAATAVAYVFFLTPGGVHSQSVGDCYPGLTVRAGERCTYPGSSEEFWVDASGTGYFKNSTSDYGLESTTRRGTDPPTTHFKAGKEGSVWVIEAAGVDRDALVATAPPTVPTGRTTPTG